jgi:hypothetical protein
MTQQEKELLLNYLSMALPYGVKCNIGLEFPLKLQRISVDMFDGILLDFFLTDINYQVYLSEVKPYLKPLSSMTEEEEEIRIKLGIWRGSQTDGYAVTRISPDVPECYNSQAFQNALKFLLREHFDIFGLIPKGLAIEVTEENNPYKTRKG